MFLRKPWKVITLHAKEEFKKSCDWFFEVVSHTLKDYWWASTEEIRVNEPYLL